MLLLILLMKVLGMYGEIRFRDNDHTGFSKLKSQCNSRKNVAWLPGRLPLHFYEASPLSKRKIRKLYPFQDQDGY